MAFEKIIFVMFMVIFILSHKSFSPRIQDIEKTAKSRTISEIYEEPVFKEPVPKSKLVTEIYNDPAAKGNQGMSNAEKYKGQIQCVEKISKVFNGNNFKDHISYAMKSLTYSETYSENCSNTIPENYNGILPDMFVYNYYRLLENFLEPGDVLEAIKFCQKYNLMTIIEKPNTAECMSSITKIFSEDPLTAVKRAFGLHTEKLIINLEDVYLYIYYDHVRNNYKIVDNESTSPEAYCSYYYGFRANTKAHLEYTVNAQQ